MTDERRSIGVPSTSQAYEGLMLVLFGAPGSGKGEQRKKLVSLYGYEPLCAGDLCRWISDYAPETPCPTALSERVAYDYVQDNPTQGRETREALSQGRMAPEEAVNAMVLAFLDKADLKLGCVLDGYPRTIHQAVLLTQLAKRRNISMVVIHLAIPDETSEDTTESIARLVERLKKRGRSDDTRENISCRLATFRTITKPALRYLNRVPNCTVLEVPALVGDVTEVARKINVAFQPPLRDYYTGSRP